MSYRKRGRVGRWEHGTLVLIDEAGEAVDARGVFESRPLPQATRGDLAVPDAELVERTARTIERVARPERLVVSHGFAEHDANGVTWTEETRRVHVAIARKDIRVLIDRADFEIDEVAHLAEAVDRAGAEREAPQRLTLAPSIAAALLPSLVAAAPPNVTLWQSGGGFDGNGVAIEEMPVVAPPWPNVFRPTYRIRPISTPLNLRLECDADVIDRDVPRAVALLAPVRGMALRVLIEDGKAVYPAAVRVVRIDAVSRDRVWYPYGAGAFGSEIML
jgi:hypothetical protein